jgi:hypothetical protein
MEPGKVCQEIGEPSTGELMIDARDGARLEHVVQIGIEEGNMDMGQDPTLVRLSTLIAAGHASMSKGHHGLIHWG